MVNMRLDVRFQELLRASVLMEVRVRLRRVRKPARHYIDMEVPAILVVQPESRRSRVDCVVLLKACADIVVDIFQRFASGSVIMREVADYIEIVIVKNHCAFRFRSPVPDAWRAIRKTSPQGILYLGTCGLQGFQLVAIGLEFLRF
jgi:hypothetical protein